MTDTDGRILLENLNRMVPKLRERGHAAEKAGRIPQETIDELHEIGAFKAFVPKSYGGMEVEFPVLMNIFRYLARGCMSTGWCMGFLIYHNFQFAHYSKKAQDETFGDKGYTMAAGQVVPGGQAKKVEGGFILNGRWGYATGILHCDYMGLPAPLASSNVSNGAEEIYRFYIPVKDFEIHDTWHVSAMKATGSRDVSLHNVFVPEHRGLPVAILREGKTPGLKINKGPLWRVPLMTFMVFGTIGPMIGGTEALLEMVTDILKTKVGSYSGDKQANLMTQKVRLARIKIELDSAIGLVEKRAEHLWAIINEGMIISREERIQNRMIISHVAKKCHDLGNELAYAAGSRGTYLDSHIQRFHRDINTLATHAIFEHDHVANMYGGTLMGIKLPESAMI
jgi:3-hydroxy-9,10-secoandrosta-1,3,5(10)-triene-9,17-dione monooxygenase